VPIRLALLAILDQGDCYGNQLRTEFERRTSGESPLNAGQVYTTLDRLERDGMVTRTPASSEGHIAYSITDEGAKEVRDWFEAPVSRESSTRDPLVMKLALALTLPGLDTRAILETELTASRARIAAEEITPAAVATPEALVATETKAALESQDSAALIVLEFRSARAEADLRLVLRAIQILDEALSSGFSTQFPVTSELPRRGRPAAGQ
jgi:DNA-binding PadR family transcriptional regulator